MKGIGYFRAEPTEYAKVSVNGKTKKEGVGISAIYLPFRTSFEMVGTTTVEQSFGFSEVTQDNQQLSLQGGFLYRVADPGKVFSRYNFAYDPASRAHLSEDAEKLPEHILQVVRVNARRIIQGTKLEPLLVMGDELSKKVSEDVIGSASVSELGLKVDRLYFSSIMPAPEIAKALGAEYRESLLQRSDEATYKRRALAIEKERTIQENELKNKIELETQREALVKLQGQNQMEEARTKAEAGKLELAVFESMTPEKLRAHALYELGRNAQRIASLTITPEILAGLRDLKG